MKHHEYAELFPMATSAELADMAEDIKKRGLLNPIIVYQNKILDGRNRFSACEQAGVSVKTKEYSGSDALGDVISWNLHRRHLTTGQKAALAVELKPMFEKQARERHASSNATRAILPPSVKGKSRDHVARTVGISGRTVSDAERIKKESPGRFNDVKSGKVTIQQAIKDIKTEERMKSRKELAGRGSKVKASEKWSIELADIKTWKTVKRYDYIITDPPYPKEYIGLYGVLAKRASELLKNGGMLIAMCGQSYLDEIYQLMTKHLDYYWCGAYMTPGQPTPLRQVNVNTTWKPLLMFIKPGDKYKGKIFGDVFTSDANDKDFHKWGQSTSGMKSIISKVCLQGQHILDPFCGAGTTGIAALDCGCFFDGIDIDEENVNISKERLNDTTKTR